MTVDTNRVQAIFLRAIELDDPAELSELLNRECGSNVELKRRVDALLLAHRTPAPLFQYNPLLPLFSQKELDPVDRSTPIPIELDRTVSLDQTGDVRSATGSHSRGMGLPLEFLEPSTNLRALGRLGHYEIAEVIGSGGFGIVLKAFDESLERVVAIKVLSPHMAATSPPRKRFIREAKTVAQVRHENVVQVYAIHEEPLPYLIMEYVPGETLQELLNRHGPLEIDEISRIGSQIALGLAAAHDMGLIHRDIKPANILLDKSAQFRVKITDFGLARAVDDASQTQSGVIAGTPIFMAPEQALGTALDHRADLFSLGSVLYTMACGHPPFRAENTLAVLKRVTEDAPRPLMEIIPETPLWFWKVVERLLAKNPADRFASAREVADLLERKSDSHATGPHTRRLLLQSSSLNVARTIRPRSRWLLALGMLLVASLAGVPWQFLRGELELVVEAPILPAGSVAVQTVTVHDRISGKAFQLQQGVSRSLPRGTYDLRVASPAGLEFERSAIEIPYWGRVVARIRAQQDKETNQRQTDAPVDKLVASRATSPHVVEKESASGDFKAVESSKLTPAEILLSEDFEWGLPQNLGSGINTDRRELAASLSSDELLLIFVRERKMFLSERRSRTDLFPPPVPLSDEFDLDLGPTVSMSGDGLMVVFCSARDGQKFGDVWAAERKTRAIPFEKPFRLLEPVNSNQDEAAPILSADGLTLCLTSQRANSNTHGRIWLFTRTNRQERFGNPEVLGPPVDTPYYDVAAWIANDQSLFFASTFSAPPYPTNLFTFDSTSRQFVKTDFFTPQQIAMELGRPWLSTDGRRLYFHTRRIPGGMGDLDLWVMERVQRKSKPQ